MTATTDITETVKAFLERMWSVSRVDRQGEDDRSLLVLAMLGGADLIKELGEDAPMPSLPMGDQPKAGV